ncbi:amidohydrolase [Colletotrichum orchidophilum]|uniref:Amidohydrolase n=1 Tax=Colletotrichum orchidophilum TaxID=1209926 RepID=A0A1G4B5C4_9PEZI|nr:amidohydrolase [Colletotrichum orchidophilum]OHE96604.1 amidohydrolase [Colletotrichum orchidophilum]
MSRRLLDEPFTIHTSLLFNPRNKTFDKDISIVVDPSTGVIADVYERKRSSNVELNGHDIDLRGKVVMPGFVDAHTHVFLHSYDEASSTVQMRDESVVERVVRATNHLRAALLSGYTTYRDLGTEGLRSFDANLRDCVNRGLLPGPRLFVATECLASTGSYEVRHENSLVKLPRISDACDGPVGVRQAVRRRAGDGADVIKFYADYRRKVMRFPPLGDAIPFLPSDLNPSVVMFNQEEMDAIVQEARLGELPVACHATTAKAALMAIKAGVDSIEHCNEATDEVFREMARRGTIFVPTLGVMRMSPDFNNISKRVKRAHGLGVRLAAGGDTGAFPHGEGAVEMELMIRAGVPVVDVLEACLMGGWESCGKEKSGFLFGSIEKGYRADIIALETDPREDAGALRKVSFVMKDGKVWKKDGRAVGFFEEQIASSSPGVEEESEWILV